MTVQEMFDSAPALINEHNEAIGQNNPGFIFEPQQVIIALKASGATSLDRLKSLSYEEILATLPATTIGACTVKPIALAKDLAKVFRGKENVATPVKSTHPAVVGRMSLRQLIENLDPVANEGPVFKRLTELFETKKFIVYNQGRNINVDATYDLAEELKSGYEERSTLIVDGDVKRTYSLGELPDNTVDENPIYKNRPLRKGEICDQTNRSWSGIPLNVRQLVRVGVDMGQFETGIDRVHNILDFILKNNENAFKTLRNRYTNVAIQFDTLAEQQKLPILRISLNRKPVASIEGPFVKKR